MGVCEIFFKNKFKIGHKCSSSAAETTSTSCYPPNALCCFSVKSDTDGTAFFPSKRALRCSGGLNISTSKGWEKILLMPRSHQTHKRITKRSLWCFNIPTAISQNVVSSDVLGQLHLHPLHGDAPQQAVLLRGQPDEGPDGADAAQLRDAAGAHLHAAAGPLHPGAQSVAGKLPVSIWYYITWHLQQINVIEDEEAKYICFYNFTIGNRWCTVMKATCGLGFIVLYKCKLRCL